MKAMKQNDFSQGKVWKSILRQAGPLIVAQFVQLAYNVVDRIYIGHLSADNNLAITGIGLTFPIITIIAAFTYMFNTGGTPLFSIARGGGEDDKAGQILGNVFSMILLSAVVLTVFCYIFRKNILFLFGAGEESFYYADQYLRIYIWGTVFTMTTTGLNGFINAQGFPKLGMITTMLGAVLNLVLDPIFIFGMHMGLGGAAIATIISQAVSATWVLVLLTGHKMPVALRLSNMKLQWNIVRQVVTLGLSGFVVQATNSFVQIVCNNNLQLYGGDLYVGIMTVIFSIREVFMLPISGINGGTQPVVGYNYGAKQYDRVKEGIRVSAYLGFGYTLLAWITILLIPKQLISVFTNNQDTILYGTSCLKIYFFGFVFMAFQLTGQHTFQTLGYAKQSIFFSLLRKVIIVVPLTILFPRIGFGIYGVFLAEPVSNVLGGLASFLTMYFTVYRKLGK